MTLQFPTTQEITHIVRNRVTHPENFIGRTFCPVRPEYVLDIQYDVLAPSFGMTRAHNIGSEPATVDVPIIKTKRFGTAYWKETLRVTEKELLYARQAGTYNQRAGRDLIVQRSLHLDTRLETRIEWLTWQSILNGQIKVKDNGVDLTAAYDIPNKNKLDMTKASKSWDDPTSDPIQDINDMILLYRGTGAKPKKMFFNAAVAKALSKNQTFRELLKYQNVQLTSMGKITDALKMLIPNIEFVQYDEGYLDESKTFQLFIPDGQIVMIGDYPSELMMDFVSTISLHNGGLESPAPGKFAIVEDKSSMAKNPYVDVTVGVYGLPRIFHPDWIISAKVF